MKFFPSRFDSVVYPNASEIADLTEAAIWLISAAKPVLGNDAMFGGMIRDAENLVRQMQLAGPGNFAWLSQLDDLLFSVQTQLLIASGENRSAGLANSAGSTGSAGSAGSVTEARPTENTYSPGAIMTGQPVQTGIAPVQPGSVKTLSGRFPWLLVLAAVGIYLAVRK